MKIRKVKTSTLILGIIAILIVAIFLGFTAGARGLGSFFPQLNLVAKPFVCPNRPMSFAQTTTQIGSDTYYSPTWFCGSEQSGLKTELNANSVFLAATPFYSLVFFAVLLIIIVVYWNSSIGPAKNDGLHLW